MKNKKLIKTIIGGLTGASLILGISALAGETFNQSAANQSATNTTQTVAAQGSASEFESTIINAVNKAKDSVVSVQNYQRSTQDLYSNYQNGYEYNQENQVDLDDPSKSQQLAGEGSGVIYKIEGDWAYLVTNNHVVDNSDSLKVKLSDGTTVDAELVGKDAISDLAVVKIPAKDAKSAITFANSDDVQVGSIAIAIGSPLGSKYSNSVTQGIISGLSRLIPVDIDKDGKADIETTLMQTDAAINPGNSGGALINKNGELIGINSSKFSDVTVEGMGFAIPSKEVQRVISMLEKDGKVTRGYLGISLVDLASVSDRSKQDILKLSSDQSEGIVIKEALKDGPAANGGLQQYDVITHIDGQAVKNSIELRRALYEHNVGDKVEVTYLREGKEAKATVTLAAQPETQTNSLQEQQQTTPSIPGQQR